MAEKHVIPYSDPYYLTKADCPSTQLGNIVFNGNNYLNWSRSVRMALGAKNKLDFIDGSLPKPDEGSEDLGKWNRNDYMVRCWLFASVSPEIADQLMLSEAAKMFWDDLVEKYGQSNAPQLYSIKRTYQGWFKMI